MGEASKQVRVDNWGIFFLQRLQIFFNKTDYCDLTLQFEGNVQLKVHRLVMNACTDYFNMLEQTCEVIDGNILVMPHDLQADVILPIVNFMYTGMLEFQMSIFDKLYNTAALMNIPVLTKLLDAQRKPIIPAHKIPSKKPQPIWNLHGKKVASKIEPDLPATLPGRKLPVWKRKSAPAPAQHVMVPHYHQEPKRIPQDPLATYDNTPKPTRFEWPEEEISSTFNLMDNSFDDISYTSKPLLTQEDELRASTSFEEVRHTPTSNKKSRDLNNQSIDMEEVKNYVKEQKIRSDLVDYEDEDDPDGYLEHIIPEKNESTVKRKIEKSSSQPNSKRVRFSINEKENKETRINVTPSGKVTDMNHTKIISEVLKKYPHLVKKNKNIRLKILAKSPVKVAPEKTQPIRTTSKLRVQVSSPKGSPMGAKLSEANKSQDEGPWVCNKCSTPAEPVEFVLYYLYRKHMTDVHNEKFDSRMCKFCGHQSNKHNMLMYHQYTRHGIKPPPAYNFPKCNRCPYIALTENLLIKHKLNHTKFDLQCTECKVAFNSQSSLASHVQITGHTGKSGRNSYDCQYCTKRYHTGSNLFSHIKLAHRNEARRDGIVSIDENEELEDEQVEEDNEEYIVPDGEDSQEKIKIISNIKVPSSGTNTETQSTPLVHPPLESNVEANALNNVTGGIATSLGLVDIVVLDDNQQYILHNDQQLVTQQSLTNSQPEYILPEISAEQHNFPQAQNISEVITSEHNVITQGMLNNSDIASTDELVMVLTDHDYNDGNSEILTNENSNIVVLYSHPVSGEQNQFITSQGNLMLNSQTGLLELRNSASETETETQETQIESIEMIQREINSHSTVITSQEETVKSDLVHVSTSTTTSTTSVEPTAQDIEVLEENQLVNDSENVELLEREVVVEVNEQVVDGSEELISTAHDSEVADSPQPEMDDETVHITGDTEEERNLQEESMEIDEECATIENTQQIDDENEKIVEESTVVEHINENLVEVMDVQNESFNEEVEVENEQTKVPEEVVDSVELNKDTVNSEAVSSDPPELHEVNNVDPEKIESTNDSEQLADKTEEIAVECADIPTDVCKSPQQSVNNPEETLDVVENDSRHSDAHLPLSDEHMETQEKQVDDLQPPVLSPQVDVNSSDSTRVIDEVSVHSHDMVVETEEDHAEVERPQSEPEEISDSKVPELENDIQAPKEDELSTVVINVTEEGKVVVHDETSQNTDENSQNQALSESGEEATKGDDTIDIENDNSQTIDDDNSQSQDSQLSQSSQDSLKQDDKEKAALKKSTCESTKIAILDDWEDTNSQQSDSNGKKAEITVKKLIHDWDDDEEEEEEDECHMEDA